jgi:hypothetical protein
MILKSCREVSVVFPADIAFSTGPRRGSDMKYARRSGDAGPTAKPLKQSFG